MAALDDTATLPAQRRPALPKPTGGLPWILLALVTAGVIARLTMFSLQAGCTAALVVLVAGLYVRSRTAGIVAAWLTWLVAPFVRRILFLSEETEKADPLALAPFLVTAVVIAFELTRVELSPRSRKLMLMVAGGYAFGILTGLVRAPQSAAFALFAYGTAAGCFIIGYREGGGERWLTWPNVLMVVAPVLALYGFSQYFFDLPEWDQVWMDTAEIETVGSPDEGRIRLWSTLNSPGTFGLVLGATAVAFVTAKRVTPLHLVGAGLVLGALALTYVRSAWVGLVVAIIAIVVATRGGALKRVAPIVLMLLVLGPVVFAGSAGSALGERFSTLGALGNDESAQARVDTPTRLLPRAIASPLGFGLGRAGEAARLGGTAGGFRYTDNGYLSLVFQVGPIGFLLVMGAVAASVRAAWRNVWQLAEPQNVLIFGTLVFFVVTMFAGDQFFGVGGMILWFTCGLAIRRNEIQQPVQPT